MTTASTVRMVRSGTPLADAAANRRSRREASGPISRSRRSTGVSLMTVVGPGVVTWLAAPGGAEDAGPDPEPPPPACPPATTGAPGARSGISTFSTTRSACQVHGAGRVNMMVMAAEQADKQPHRRWWHRGPFVHREVRLSVGTLLVFLFVFYVAFPLLASHRSEFTSLTHINTAYLALGVILEIAALVAYTQLTHAVLPHSGPSRFRLFRINMSTLALSHVSPGGTAPGAALGYRLLTQSGVSGSDTGFALGTQGIGSAVVLNVIFGLANILAAVPITPGGLGIVEFVLVSMITGFGPTAGQALSAVLAYRAVNFWLPIPFGGLAYASLELERRAPHHRLREYLQGRVDLRHERAAPSAPQQAASSTRASSRFSGASGSSPSTGGVAAPPPTREQSPAPALIPGELPGSHRGDAVGIRGPVLGSDPAG